MTLFACTSSQKKDKEMEQPDSLRVAKDVFIKDSITIINENVFDWISKQLGKTPTELNNIALEEYYKNDSLPAESFEPGKEFFTNYASVLRWSPDSNYVLDIGSYGSVLIKDENGTTKVEAGEPDTEIALIEPAKKQKKSLFFAGPSSTIFNARWVSKDDALILGSFDESGNGYPDTLFWMVNVKDNFYRMYKWKK
jgi:hypothetical protein